MQLARPFLAYQGGSFGCFRGIKEKLLVSRELCVNISYQPPGFIRKLLGNRMLNVILDRGEMWYAVFPCLDDLRAPMLE